MPPKRRTRTLAATASPRSRRRPAAASPARSAKSAAPSHAGVGDDAVRTATGRGWADWLDVLDRFDVRANGHKAAAVHLHDEHGVDDWWAQMVVVGYEQARGLRKKHQKPTGFEVSASRVMGCGVERAYAAFADAALRRKWLPDPDVTIRTATPHRSMRLRWIDGRTIVSIGFEAKGAGKCQVSAQHGKLPSAAAGERMKKYWGAALDALRGLLAAPAPRS